jgi:hypothetical protein
MDLKPKKAVAVSRWSDMVRFGVAIQPRVTSSVVPLNWHSSAASSVRDVFVLNAEGCRLLQEYWGLVEAKFETVALDVRVNGEHAVGKVFLPYSELMPLAEFALFRMEPIGLAFRNGSIKAIFDQALYDKLRATHTLKFNDVRHSLRVDG